MFKIYKHISDLDLIWNLCGVFFPCFLLFFQYRKNAKNIKIKPKYIIIGKHKVTLKCLTEF